MKVQTNLSAMNAYRMHSDTTRKLSKTTERLSSGYKINRAGDDAAGLTISENMRREIRGLKQASSNCQDGISFSQIADGALGEVNDMIHRSKELAVKASNGTLTDADREAVQSEMTEIMKEIDRVSESTQFNTIEIFPKEGHSPDELTVASEGANSFTVENSFIMGGTKVNVAASQEIGQDTAYADSDMAKFIVSAASNAIKKIEAAYPNLMGTAESKTVNIGLKIGNIDGKGNTLASAQVSLFSRDGKQMAAYTMNVDKIDYPLSKFSSMSDAQKADLAAVVAHEMTHIVMYDTTTKGMLNGDIPKWFVEGMAQTSSGDNGWVSNKISSTSTNEAIKNYMSQLSSMPYGAGYLATMYLGQLASGSATVSSANIKTGLDKILQQLANGKSLDDAIKLETSLSGGQAEFENKFKTGDASALGFVKDLLTERGSGAGSLLAANLSDSEAVVFAPASLDKSADNYIVKPGNTKYANAFGTGPFNFPAKEKGIFGLGAEDIVIQAGADGADEQRISVMRFCMSSKMLFGEEGINLREIQSARNALEKIDTASDRVSSVRSYYGGIQNRLEHTVSNLDNIVENTQSAESQIRDADMASEVVNKARLDILSQAGMSMMSQANQSTQGVLSLLQ